MRIHVARGAPYAHDDAVDALVAALPGASSDGDPGEDHDAVIGVGLTHPPALRARRFVAWSRNGAADPEGWDGVVHARPARGTRSHSIPDGFPPLAAPGGSQPDRLVCPHLPEEALAPLLDAWPALWARFRLPLWIVGGPAIAGPGARLPGVVVAPDEPTASRAILRAVGYLSPCGSESHPLARSAAAAGVRIVGVLGDDEADLIPLCVPVVEGWAAGVTEAIAHRASLAARLQAAARARPWARAAEEWIALLERMEARARPHRWGAPLRIMLLAGPAGPSPEVERFVRALTEKGVAVDRLSAERAAQTCGLREGSGNVPPVLLDPSACSSTTLAAIEPAPVRPPIAALLPAASAAIPGLSRVVDTIIRLDPPHPLDPVREVLAWLERKPIARHWRPPELRW